MVRFAFLCLYILYIILCKSCVTSCSCILCIYFDELIYFFLFYIFILFISDDIFNKFVILLSTVFPPSFCLYLLFLYLFSNKKSTMTAICLWCITDQLITEYCDLYQYSIYRVYQDRIELAVLFPLECFMG